VEFIAAPHDRPQRAGDYIVPECPTTLENDEASPKKALGVGACNFTAKLSGVALHVNIGERLHTAETYRMT
jgi:hypothetical protein